jgi:hypothetical protein
VVAAKHEWNSAFFYRRARRLIQAMAHLRDVSNELLFWIAVLLRFRNRRRQIAAIDNDTPERRNLLA